MKIAHLDTGRTWRGGQAQVLWLLRGLRDRGHESLLLAPSGPLLERALADGFAVHKWSPLGEWDLAAVGSAAAVLRGSRPDMVHCHSAHAHTLGVAAARWVGVPGVVVSRRVDFEIGRHLLSRLKYRMPVDRYLCISRGVMEVMARGGLPAERLALVPSGIALASNAEPEGAHGDSGDLRSLIGVGPSTPVIGTIAALAPHKNHADLLLAAARVVERRQDAHFVWVGEGECRRMLERRRSRLGLDQRVHMLGFRRDAHALMRQFTLFVLSSYLEGLCTSLLDAQSLGVPVVATAVGGVPDVVQDGVSGRLVPGRDPEALARAILEALDRPDQARGWADRARVSVRDFEVDRMVDRTLEVYGDVLRARRVAV